MLHGVEVIRGQTKKPDYTPSVENIRKDDEE
jgi:hypothetical protein